MMKYRLHIASLAIAALPLLTSCSDSYPGMDFPVDDSHVSNEESLNKTPVMVFINPQRFFSVSATRSTEYGTGIFDATDAEKYKRKYRNSDFYIYAFRTAVEPQGPLGGVSVDLSKSRWNTTVDEEREGKYCLIDGPGGRGLRSRLTADEPGALSFDFKNEDGVRSENDFVQYDPVLGTAGAYEHDYVKYFSARYTTTPYNFFGYYIDNVDSLESLTHTDIDSENRHDITYKFTIDGSQDILCGYAPFTPEKLEEKKKGLSNTEYQNILNYGGFTTYAAHRSVYPEIELKHQLVRLDFSALPGDVGADDITITGIFVECPTTCILTVASNKLENVKADFEPGDNPGVYVREDSEDGLKETTELKPFCLAEQPVSASQPDVMMTYDYVKKYREDFKKDPEAIKVGGSLLVPEAEKYHVTLEFEQQLYVEQVDGNKIPGEKRTARVEYELSIGGNKKFEKGYYYPIQISVFGFREIEMTANITPWQPGGDVDVDTDGIVRE